MQRDAVPTYAHMLADMLLPTSENFVSCPCPPLGRGGALVARRSSCRVPPLRGPRLTTTTSHGLYGLALISPAHLLKAAAKTRMDAFIAHACMHVYISALRYCLLKLGQGGRGAARAPVIC